MDTKALRQIILDLAIHGKLVPQDPNDEPAAVLLKRINPKAEISSDNELYGKVPEGWCICKLEDIISYEQPTSYIVNSTDYDDTYPTPVLTAGKSFVIGRTKETDGIYSNLPCIIFDDFTTDSKLVDFPFKVKSSAMKILQVSKDVKIEYVSMFMSVTRLIGDTHKRYWISEYSKLDIPLPPLPEQRRIVSKIESLFSLISLIETGKSNLQSAVKQAKSKILDLAIHGKLVPQDPNDEPAAELLKRINPKAEISSDNELYGKMPEGWCVVKVKDVFVINPKNKIDEDIDAGFVPMANISDGFLNQFSYEKKKWKSIKSGFTHFADGDIAVAKISPCLENRKSMVLDNLPNGIGAGTTELHIFRPLLCLTQLYGLYFFKSDYFINQCVGTFNGVVGQQRVGKSIVGDISIPLPPLPEQRRIVAKIEELFSQLDLIEASL